MTDNRIFKLDLERQSEIIDCTLETLGAIRLSGPVGLITVLCAKSRLRDLFGGSQLPRRLRDAPTQQKGADRRQNTLFANRHRAVLGRLTASRAPFITASRD